MSAPAPLPAASEDAAIALPPDKFHRVLAGLLLVLALSSLDANIVGPALPLISSEFGALDSLTWVLTIFLLTSTAATPLYGKLSDMYGRRPLLTIAVLLFLAGSAFSGLAQSMNQLILGRAIQGVGAGGLMTLTQITMSDLVSPRRRGSYQGLFGAVFTIASLAGPPLGGVIAEFWSWRWIFYVNLPLGAAALTLLWMGLPPGVRTTSHRIDVLGFVVIMAATSCVLMALNQGSHGSWTSPIVISLAVAAVVLALLLGPIEARAKEPLIPLAMVGNSVWLIATGVATLVTIAVFGALAFMPLYLQLAGGLSPTASGIAMVPSAAGLMLSLLYGGRAITRTGRYKVFAVTGVGVATLALFALALAAYALPSPYLLGALLFPLGAGLGLLMPGLTVAYQNAVAHEDIGTATSTAGFFRSLGGAFGIAVAGAILAMQAGGLLPAGGGAQDMDNIGLGQLSQLSPSAQAMVLADYQWAMVTIFAAAGVVAALAFALIRLLPEQELSDVANRPASNALESNPLGSDPPGANPPGTKS
ncbi:major facilitator superfamily MFS_1 [Xanthobacter versatilis]|uniref:Major facilitator superfamily MFS_1 n=1 Tax=Xanthobacter autotrophicus (strain ATCC BAA-1158 / Py2) TaxID=78245 RepID=A7IE08_XANP2|nr:major facilitator superfamily MFS_1 [Xanthobacter autotrophicus Py2]